MQSFESSVNSEGIETNEPLRVVDDMFESSVNSEGIETKRQWAITSDSLRAV